MKRKTPLKRSTGMRQSAIRWNADGICKHGRRRGDCRSCISARNKRFGQAVQHEMHTELGGTGPTPHDEEAGRGYDVETIRVHPEAKGGQQIPKSIVTFLETDWFRRAMSQSSRSLPIGSTARPALWLHLPGGRRILLVDYGQKGGKA